MKTILMGIGFCAAALLFAGVITLVVTPVMLMTFGWSPSLLRAEAATLGTLFTLAMITYV